MPLNARQERFVENLVAKGMNATAAYKAAGYAGKTDATARAGASELLTNPNVRMRVAELQRHAADKAAVTAESIAAELDIAFNLALENKQAAACVAASMGKAKLFGLIVDKAHVETKAHRPAPEPDVAAGVLMSEDEWEQRLQRH